MNNTNWDQAIREEARQYAESQMPENWNRMDRILIPVFYGHFIDYIIECLRKASCWNMYDNWKETNYRYSDYEDKWYQKAKTGPYEVGPFSHAYDEMDIRQKYIEQNNL